MTTSKVEASGIDRTPNNYGSVVVFEIPEWGVGWRCRPCGAWCSPGTYTEDQCRTLARDHRDHHCPFLAEHHVTKTWSTVDRSVAAMEAQPLQRRREYVPIHPSTWWWGCRCSSGGAGADRDEARSFARWHRTDAQVTERAWADVAAGLIGRAR